MLLRSLSAPWLLVSLAAAQAVAVESSAIAPPLPDAVAEAIAMEGIEHSQVMRLLRDLTGKIGHRLTGSDNFTNACAWAKGEFGRMGLQVELEKWGEWKLGWNRGKWIGRITQPVQLDMYVATQAWTAGTKGLQKAPVVVEPDWNADDAGAGVAGKWVLSKTKFRLQDPHLGQLAKRIGEAKGLGLVYRAGDPDKDFPTRVRVFGDNKVAMQALADVPTTPEIAVQADHFDQLVALVDEGKNVECEFDIQNTFREGPIELCNVIATLPGTEKPDEWVVVSSHLDSWHQVQGTTDNGTGTTSTMEAARILMAVKAKPKRSIKFCLWGGEEEGLLGSRGWVTKHRPEMAKVSACFNHDTGTNWAQSLNVTPKMKEQLAPIFAQVNRLLKAPDNNWTGDVFTLRPRDTISAGGGSDHASFMSAGVPGLDWGLKGRSNYFQHTWHTQWDTIDVAIEEYQRHTATVIAMAALGTANLPELLDRTGVVAGGGGANQSAALAASWFEAEMEEFTFKSVKEGGRAAKMGVQKGDVLKRVGGQDVERTYQIFRFAREAEGDSVTFTFQRGDKTFDAKSTKNDLPAQQQRGDRGGNQTPRDTVPPAGGNGGQPPAPAGNGGGNNGGGNGGGGNNGNGGRDDELSWGIGVQAGAGVQGTFALPKSDSFPLGATRLESQVRDRELLRWVAFTDFGLLGVGINDPSFGELRVSSGVGLRIDIPVLEIPIAPDLAWPWICQDTEDRRQLYFSISR
jgi:hypothetical protein